MKFKNLATVVCLFPMLLTADSNADVLTWNFSIDEQQVKNGPEPDGSTNSPGSGSGNVSFDTDTNFMSYSLQWDNMVGDLTKLHIHGPADVDHSNPQHVVEFLGPPAVPAELVSTSGSIAGSFELTTLVQTGFDPLTPAEIVGIMVSGQSYLNVHTTVFGTGEIRGNLGVPIPEPSSVAMLLGTIAALLFVPRR